MNADGAGDCGIIGRSAGPHASDETEGEGGAAAAGESHLRTMPPHNPSRPEPAPHSAVTLERFSAATRALHWVNAVPFLLLLLTGLLILVPEIKSYHIGGYRLVPLLHVVVGLAFVAALPLTVLAVRGRRALRDDVAEALTPEPGDLAWLRYAALTALGARLRQPPTSRFNAGQKLNNAFWIVITGGLTATGLVLAVNYFTKRIFSASFVEQVFPWHTTLMIVSLPVLAAHLYLALLNPATRPSLRGILTGRVDAAWARLHHSRWAAEVEPPMNADEHG